MRHRISGALGGRVGGGARLYALIFVAGLVIIPAPFARAQATGADLQLTCTTPTTEVGPNQFVPFDLTVSNNGPATAILAVVEETTPVGLTYFSADIPAGWSIIAPPVGGSGLIRISKPAFTASTSETMTLTLRVSSTGHANVRINNSITVSSNTPDPVPSNNTCATQLRISGTSVDSPGVYNSVDGSWFLRNTNTAGTADYAFVYGTGGSSFKPLKGDWNNDGIDTVGLYDQSTGAVFLRNSNSSGAADIVFNFGPAGAGWLPIAGDWNNDGIDTIGLYDPVNGAFFLKNSNTSGAADNVFFFGPSGGGLLPLAGDWDSNLTDTIGLYNPSTGAYFLKNTNSGGAADVAFIFGAPFASPVVGDWDGNGQDTIGSVQTGSAAWFLRNVNSPGTASVTFVYGTAGLTPIAGDWNGF